eukprot:Gb_39943 [translate_table: standard]
MENPTNSTSGGGPDLMSFGMPQYGNYGFNLGANPRMPNFSYGFNGGFPYMLYPIPSYQLNDMMQYSILGNTFGFVGPFPTPFTNNETPIMLNPNNHHGGINNNGHNDNGSNSNSHNDNGGNGGNGGNNNSCNGNGGNGDNINDGGSASNGPNVFQFSDTSLQHLKYEGYSNPSKHVALFLNNIVQQGITNEVAIKQRFFSTLHKISLQWYECIKDNSWPMIKEQFLDCFQTLRNPSAIYKALQVIKQPTEETIWNYDGRL